MIRLFAISRCIPPNGQLGTIFLDKVKHTSQECKATLATRLLSDSHVPYHGRMPLFTRGLKQETGLPYLLTKDM
jgi:hypothetical protein